MATEARGDPGNVLTLEPQESPETQLDLRPVRPRVCHFVYQCDPSQGRIGLWCPEAKGVMVGKAQQEEQLSAVVGELAQVWVQQSRSGSREDLGMGWVVTLKAHPSVIHFLL